MTAGVWRLLGAGLIAVGIALVLLVTGADGETLRALGTALGIFGAAMILRTIGSSRG